MHILCLDLEGVLVPEIWLGVAERTGIDDLRLTTRDIRDYDELMQHRLRVLDREGVTLALIQEVISELRPLPGASSFLDAMRRRYQVAILSDTFYEFATPLMAQLGLPFLLCHRLAVEGDRIVGYQLRQPDPKRAAVKAFHGLRYRVVAAGDSFNDVAMLEEADAGIFFSAPDNVTAQFPQYPTTANYDALAVAIEAAIGDIERQ